jgi:26S proteasome regulatory subunit T2
LKLERIKDFLLIEEEFITNQEILNPKEESVEQERTKVDQLRGTPIPIGTLEEIIDDNHAIIRFTHFSLKQTVLLVLNIMSVFYPL